LSTKDLRKTELTKWQKDPQKYKHRKDVLNI
jgi:hypothetical protein